MYMSEMREGFHRHMTKNRWKKKITEACQAAGVYEPFFDSIIETLADILHKRDEAQALYKKSGGRVIIKHTNKGGATNLVQNPALRLINDLNRDALTYWRDLCLTPAAFKRLNEPAKTTAKTEEPNALMQALESFKGEDDG